MKAFQGSYQLARSKTQTSREMYVVGLPQKRNTESQQTGSVGWMHGSLSSSELAMAARNTWSQWEEGRTVQIGSSHTVPVPPPQTYTDFGSGGMSESPVSHRAMCQAEGSLARLRYGTPSVDRSAMIPQRRLMREESLALGGAWHLQHAQQRFVKRQ